MGGGRNCISMISQSRFSIVCIFNINSLASSQVLPLSVVISLSIPYAHDSLEVIARSS